MKTYKYILSKKLKLLLFSALVVSVLGLSLVWAHSALGQTASKAALTIEEVKKDGSVVLRITPPAATHTVHRQTGDNNDMYYKIVDTTGACVASAFTPRPDTGVDVAGTTTTGNTADGFITRDNSQWGRDSNDGKYFCLEALYTTLASPTIIDASKTQYFTVKIDGTAPTINSNGVVTASKAYTAVDVGKAIDVSITFSEPVNLLSAPTGDNYGPHPSTVTDVPRFTFGSGTNSLEFEMLNVNPQAKVAASGTTFTFRHILDYNQSRAWEVDGTSSKYEMTDTIAVGGSPTISLDPAAGGSPLYELKDSQGNSLASLGISSSHIKDFTLSINTTALPTINRVKTNNDNELVATITPRTWRKTVNDTTTTVSTIDQSVFYKASKSFTDCKALIADSTSTKVAGTEDTSIDHDDVVKMTLPATADDMYYCLRVADEYTVGKFRYGYSNIYRYEVDNAKPQITWTIANNKLTIKATDATSGIADLYWFLSNECDDLTVAPTQVQRTETYNIVASRDGHKICIVAIDKAGLKATQSVTLVYTDSATTPTDPVTPVDPTDPVTAPDDDDDDDSSTDDDSTDDDSTSVPPFAGLPDNWDQLTPAEKTAANPYRCLDTTKIRADNGQCISGGSEYDADDIANPVPGDDSTTEPGDATDPSDGSTTEPGDTTDPDDGSTTDPDDGSTGTGDEGSEQPADSISLSYDSGSKTMNVSTTGTVTELQYAIVEDSTDCATLEDGDYDSVVDGSAITIAEEDVDKYVCVKGVAEDGVAVYSSIEQAAVATDPGDGTGTGDEEGGGIAPWVIVLAIVVVIGIVVAIIVASNKKNNQL